MTSTTLATIGRTAGPGRINLKNMIVALPELKWAEEWRSSSSAAELSVQGVHAVKGWLVGCGPQS